MTVEIAHGAARLGADLLLPPGARGVVLFAHGSGSGRGSPRNRAVADRLSEARIGSLLIDLLTDDEEAVDQMTGKHRFDIDLLGGRVVAGVDWLSGASETRALRIGLYGASTGAAAALVAAAERADLVRAVVSRGGRPDLADAALPAVRAPTLLIVGELDPDVLVLNQRAAQALRTQVALEIVPGASHLFEEPGTLDRVAELTVGWFERFLWPPQSPDRPRAA
jgi:putative phosphoribosyl transferase